MVRRVDIQAHDVADLDPGPRVAQDPGRPHLVRPGPVALQDAGTSGAVSSSLFASACSVQCRARGGGGIARPATALTVPSGAGSSPGGRVASRSGPSTPCPGKRSHQRSTAGTFRSAAWPPPRRPPTRGRGWSGRARRASGCSADPSRSVRGVRGRRPKAWFPVFSVSCPLPCLLPYGCYGAA